MEAALVCRAGIAFRAVPAAGVHGVGWRRLPGNLLRLGRGVLRARQVVGRFRPQVALFTGGYVGVPVALALGRVPRVVFVPDLEPGLAHRMLVRMAALVAVNVEPTLKALPPGRRAQVVGYPLRKALRGKRGDRREARGRLGLRADRPVLLVLGGSRGARSINEALWSHLTVLLPKVQVVHVTGERDWPKVENVRSGLPRDLADEYHPFPYLHEEMGDALQAADLVVSRAGASTLGEYPYFGLPAILVPYPYAWRYQRSNAAYLVQAGAARMLEDSQLQERLAQEVLALIADRKALRAMREAAAALSRPQAAADLAQALIRVVEERGGPRG
jgi:UDP-N-acetylglucosamine--N-acetylmuramyl-(pentapeptide) pyrophosphoryl-undecaprenol N-acetylglucosamine transferase